MSRMITFPLTIIGRDSKTVLIPVPNTNVSPLNYMVVKVAVETH